jgi:hypothetical protein
MVALAGDAQVQLGKQSLGKLDQAVGRAGTGGAPAKSSKPRSSTTKARSGMHSIASDRCPVPPYADCASHRIMGDARKEGAGIRAARRLGRPEGPLQEADSALVRQRARQWPQPPGGPRSPPPLLAARCNSDCDRPPGTS